jgi:hypothetical protein
MEFLLSTLAVSIGVYVGMSLFQGRPLIPWLIDLLREQKNTQQQKYFGSGEYKDEAPRKS